MGMDIGFLADSPASPELLNIFEKVPAKTGPERASALLASAQALQLASEQIQLRRPAARPDRSVTSRENPPSRAAAASRENASAQRGAASLLQWLESGPGRENGLRTRSRAVANGEKETASEPRVILMEPCE